MAANWEKLISEQYEKTLAAQKAQIEMQYAQKTAAYQQQLKEAATQYQSLKNEAYVNNALAEKTRRENMANMGLSGHGGTSQTLQQRNTAQLLSQLGMAARQEQGFADNVNLALANLQKQYGADVAALEADSAAKYSNALLEQSRWQANYELNMQRQARAEQQALFNQAYNLYVKRLITAAQFKAMTGVSVRR